MSRLLDVPTIAAPVWRHRTAGRERVEAFQAERGRRARVHPARRAGPHGPLDPPAGRPSAPPAPPRVRGAPRAYALDGFEELEAEGKDAPSGK